MNYYMRKCVENTCFLSIKWNSVGSNIVLTPMTYIVWTQTVQMLYATSSFGIYIRSKCVQVWNNTSNCILFFPFPISYCDFSWFRLILQLLECGSEGSKYLQSLKFLILLRSATCCVPWIKNLWAPCDSFLTQQVMWVPDQNRLQQISGTFFCFNQFWLNLSKHTCRSERALLFYSRHR